MHMTVTTDCKDALAAHAKGDWKRAHELVQQHEGNTFADWIHAMLHRDEGDHGNAGYWYRRAGKPASNTSIEVERQSILAALNDE